MIVTGKESLPKAIGQAAEAGIISGYSDNSFRPGANITRAELAVMIARSYSTEAMFINLLQVKKQDSGNVIVI